MSKEVLEKIGELGSVFEDYKQANDERLKRIEKGQSTSDLDEKIEKMDAAIASLSKEKAELEERLKSFEAKGNRLDGGGESSEYAKDFEAFMRKGDEGELSQKSINTGTDADGGFAVPESWDKKLLELLGEQSPMRQIANVITIGTDNHKKTVNKGGAAAGWVGETDSRGETDAPKLGQVEATMGELYANPAVTQRALDDIYFNVESWITGEIAEAFAEKEGEAFLLGNGSNKPIGLLTAKTDAKKDKERDFGKVQLFTSSSAGIISGDDLIEILYGLKKGYRKRAKWMLNSATLAEIRKLKDSEGNYLWRPGLELSQPDLINGYGIVENEDMPDLATGAKALTFGDYKRSFTIVDRIGTRMLRDPYFNKPYVHFYTTKRTGSMITDTNAVKFLQIQ